MDRLYKAKKFTFRVSHFLHSCWGNHDRHWNFEAQDGGGHVNLAHINQNSWPESAFSDKRSKVKRWLIILQNLILKIKKQLTEFLRKHFYSQLETTGPLHLMHSSQRPSLAIFASRWPHTPWRWWSPSFLSKQSDLTIKWWKSTLKFYPSQSFLKMFRKTISAASVTNQFLAYGFKSEFDRLQHE